MNVTPEELIQAAEALEREAKRYQGITAAAKVLRELGTLENQAREAVRRKAGVDADLAAAREELHQVKAAAAQASEEIEAARQGAARELEAGKQAALIEARKAHAEAVAQAEAIVAAAREEAAGIAKAGAQAQAEVEALLSQAGDELKAADERLHQKRAELADLEARLAEARSQAARIIGVGA